MYGRRYIRLLFVVTVLVVLLVLVLLSSDYPLQGLSSQKSASSSSSSSSSSHNSFEFIPSFLSPKAKQKADERYKQFELTKDQLVDAFPLDKTLLSDSYYDSASLTTFTDPYSFISSKSANYEFVKQDVCRSLKFTGDFKMSPQTFLAADFKKLSWALSQVPDYAQIIQDAKQKFESKIPVEKQWLRFGGSSVWLPYFKVHYMVSRVLYTPSGIPNKAFVSFLYVQLFDTNWKELPPQTLKLPYEQKVSQNQLNTDGSITHLILDSNINYREIEFPSFLPIPVEVKFDSDDNKHYWGPEDPRVLARTNSLGFEEPIILFNMKSVKLVKRVMHQYLPFSHEIKVLKKRDEPWANIEKNWTPFISATIPKNRRSNKKAEDYEPAETFRRESDDYLNFIYSIEPLEILTCEIDSGICDFLQKPEKDDANYVGPLRGGSQLVKFPFSELIPDHVKKDVELPANRQVYVGWARAHLDDCGCGEAMYRPNLIVLVEDYNPSTKKFYYKLADVSESFDFHAEVPAWIDIKTDENGELLPSEPEECNGRNVLIPNSIAYWDIHAIHKNLVSYQRKFFDNIPTDHELDDKNAMKVTKIENSFKRSFPGKQRPVIDLTKRLEDPSNYPIFFDDFMGVTLSAADSDVSIVHVRGLLNYILHLPGLFEESNVIQDDDSFQLRGYNFNNECAMDGSKEYCRVYGEEHQGAGPAPKGVFNAEEKHEDEKPQRRL